MSEFLATLGWRRVSKRVIATEAFCDPPHKGVIKELRRLTPDVVMCGDALRWGMGKNGKLQPLDSLEGVHPSTGRRVAELADIVFRAMTSHLEDVTTLEVEEVTSDMLVMFTQRRKEIMRLVRRMMASPSRPTEDPFLAFTVNYGSPIAIVGTDTTPPMIEKVVECDEESRILSASYPVRNLPPVRLCWDNRMVCTLPGVPQSSPIAGWTLAEDMLAKQIARVFHEAVLSV